MPLLEDVKKLEHKDFVLVVVAFLSIVAPGILILQMFQPQLFATLDTLKVLFLSISITLPVFAINFSGIGYAQHVKKVRQREPFNDGEKTAVSGVAMLATFGILYPAIFVTYLFDLSARHFVLAVCAIQAIAIGLEYGAIRKAKAIPAKPIISPGGS